MSTEDNKAVVRRFIDEAWNRRNPSALAELVAADYIGHPLLVLPEAMTGFPTEQPIQGPAGIKDALAPWYTGFPQAQVTVDEIIAEGDRVVTRHTLRGTQDGPFWRIAPSHRPVTVSMISIRRMAGGQIAEEWQVWDTLPLLQQIGVVPGPEELPLAASAIPRATPNGLILPPAENKAILRRYYDEAVNAGQWSLLADLIAPDFVDLSTGAPQPFSTDGLRQVLVDWEIAFPTSHYAIEDTISEGDLAVARLTWRAVHGGPFQGLPATGNALSLTQMVLVRIADGLITERWSILDRFGLLIQLGILAVSTPDKRTKPSGGRPAHGGGPERWSKDPGT